jgi:hypothetical protein
VLDFLLTQGTSAPAKQYSVLIIHVFLLSFIGSVERPYIFKRDFHQCRSADEMRAALEGDPPLLALAERNVSISLAQTIDRAECGGT